MADRDGIVDEATSLLPPRNDRHDSTQTKASPESRKIILLMYAIIFTVTFAVALAEGPLISLMEQSICFRWAQDNQPDLIGPDGSVEQKFCKISPVRSKLGTLRSWMVLMDTLPALVFTFPYGALADKYGRKWFIVLNLVSFSLRSWWMFLVVRFPQQIAPDWILMEGIFVVMGGGSLSFSALVTSIIANATTEGMRTTVFLRITAVQRFTALLGPVLNSVFLDKYPWQLVIVALITKFIAIICGIFMPWILPSSLPTKSNNHKSTQADPATSIASMNESGIEQSSSTFTSRMLSKLPSVAFLKNRRLVGMLFLNPPFMAHYILADIIFLQYISYRFSVSYARASTLGSVHAAVGLVSTLFLLPFLSEWMVKPGGLNFTPRTRDLFLSKISFGCLALGALLMGLAPTYPLMAVATIIDTLGIGAESFAQAYIVAMVKPDQMGKLSSVIAITQTGGASFFSPALAKLWIIGSDLKWTGGAGLPFLVVSALLFVTTGALCTVKSGRDDLVVEAEVEDAEEVEGDEHGDRPLAY